MTKPTQLTIEHLAAHMPYDVGAKWNKYPRKRFKLQGVLYGKPWLIDSSSCTEKAQIHDIKLVLRPLSQLTVPITHNGKTFEPMERLKSEMPYSIEIMLSSVSEINPNDTPYGIVTRCLSWHFDVFGLIEAGLAVAMNPDGTI